MQGVQRFGNYFLLKKIATGGMAELHKAKKSGEKGFEKHLAIKLILPHLSENEDFITMFIDEAKVAALLNHQNIVQIYDLGKIENSYCIVMEYIRGKDLRSVLYRGMKLKRPLPVEHACLITAQALAGLSYAHRKKDKGKDLKIVHRDVSPQNILVSYEGEVKIVDFGIAKAATQSRDTKVGVLKGKISYMSPEQARGKALDMRSDIFSTGVVFYEMLTGKKLFQGDTDLNTLEKVREAKVEPLPTELNTSVPKELEEILLKSLAQEPEQRFQTASEMEEALLAFMRKAGYSTSANTLSQFMCVLFKEEIEEEMREEGGWDETIVSAQPGTGSPATSTVPAGAAKPSPYKPKNPPQAAAPAPKSREIGRGMPAWQKALIGILIVSAGAGLWLKFRQASVEAPQAREQAAAQEAQAQPVGTAVQEAPAPPAAVPAAQETRPAPAPVKQVKASEPAASKAPEPARATINSNPSGAEVFIDGARAGTTPLALDAVAPGRRQVKIAKAGYEAWSASLNAEPGRAGTVNATLKEAGFRLTVNSTPSGAKVYIDGSDTGRLTPASFDDLKPERQYSVKVAINGYGSHEQTVVSRGDPVGVNAALSQQYGTFSIDSRPWFFVIIDGEEKGTTPLAGIKLAAGEHKMVLANPKLKIKRQVKLRIEPNKTTRIIIDPEGKPPVKEIIK